MSFQASLWAWSQIRSGNLPFRSRFVLLALTDRHNGDTSQCNPSIKRLCADTGLHREAIMEAIKCLESANIVAVERKLGSGSCYRFIGFNLKDPSVDYDRSMNTDPSAKAYCLPGRNQSVNTDQSAKINPSISDDQSVNTDTEPVIEPIKEPVNIKMKNKSAKPESFPELFSDFYLAYPRKKSRQKAEAAWKKINPDESLFEEIMARLDRAKKSRDWLKNNGQYIPHPATWLNGRLWEDGDYELNGLTQPNETFLGISGLI